MRSSVWLTVCAALVVGAAQADPVSIAVLGGAAGPVEGEPDVRMVSEDLRIDLAPDEATVTADMQFHNEGDAQDLVMGFPQISRPDRGAISLKGMTFTVDGEDVASEHLPPDGDECELVPAWLGVDSWHVATVPFEADQMRRVRISFKHDHGGSAPGFGMGYDWFLYVLSTARQWKGTVDRIKVTVTFGEMVGAFAHVFPAEYRLDEAARTIEWDLTDFDGDPGDIRVAWWPTVSAVSVRDEPIRAHAYLGKSWTPVIDVVPLAEVMGWQWSVVPGTGEWVLETGGHQLTVIQDEERASLDGADYDLRCPPRPPLGHGTEGLRGGCMLALGDLMQFADVHFEPDGYESHLKIR